MKYEEALEKWGILKLGTCNNLDKFESIVRVNVEMNFDEGYNCCNGSNPDCYCSFAKSPTSEVVVTGFGVKANGKESYLHYSMDAEDFDFATMIRELFEVNELEV